jgi:hypothetical protein
LGDAGRIPAEIAHTDFDIEVDAALGTVIFRNYFQTIDSLNLFGVETGEIVVTIVEALGGQLYADGTFDTLDTFEVRYFTDLRALGLPIDDPDHPELGGAIELTSPSTGRLDVEPTFGTAQITWTGSDSLLGFAFAYECSMNAVFAATAPSYISLELSPLLDNTPMPDNLRALLGGILNEALTAFHGDNNYIYVRLLTRFIHQVQRAGSAIAPPDALALINGARTAIALVQHPLLLPQRGEPSKATKRAPSTPE